MVEKFMVNVKTVCRKCSDVKFFMVDGHAYQAWQKRELYIQDAFPDITPEDRERFISSTCPTCWTKIFG